MSVGNHRDTPKKSHHREQRGVPRGMLLLLFILVFDGRMGCRWGPWFAKGELLFQLEPLLLLFLSSTFASFTLKSTTSTTTTAKANNAWAVHEGVRGGGARERDETCHYTEKPLKSVLFKHCFIVFRNYGYKESGFFWADEGWEMGFGKQCGRRRRSRGE